jgi:hypothetical protein
MGYGAVGLTGNWLWGNRISLRWPLHRWLSVYTLCKRRKLSFKFRCDDLSRTLTVILHYIAVQAASFAE